MANYFKYVGLKKVPKPQLVRESFKPALDVQMAQRYLDYVKELDSYHRGRRETIENKNSQLVGQASIVSSIFALFIPLIVDAFNGITYLITIPLSIVFCVVLVHYLMTILHSINTLKINRYPYATRKTSTITKEQRAIRELDFLNEEISDLIYSINQSTPSDNQKGDNLVFATRCFEIANVGFVLLSVGIIISAFFLKKEPPEILLKNANDIRLILPDTLKAGIINYPKIDSLALSLDTLNGRLIIESPQH